MPANRVMERFRRAMQRTFGAGGIPRIEAEMLLHALCRERHGSTIVVNKVALAATDLLHQRRALLKHGKRQMAAVDTKTP